ncbi:MAG: adenine phosphoribosyltransferase [Phycisphaerae bacterium]
MDLEKLIRDVPDFPKKGIVFKDITPLLSHPEALKETADRMAEPFRNAGIEQVAGVESRGFIFGTMLADRLDAGFIPIRKPGKLPAEKISRTYGLEYGTATIEIHTDAVSHPGQKILMVDDLLATGGTMEAACHLIEKLGGEIAGVTFLIELGFLPGREKLAEYDVRTLMTVDGE